MLQHACTFAQYGINRRSCDCKVSAMVCLSDNDRLHVCIWLAAFDLPHVILTILTDQDIRPQQDAVMPFWFNICKITFLY